MSLVGLPAVIHADAGVRWQDANRIGRFAAAPRVDRIVSEAGSAGHVRPGEVAASTGYSRYWIGQLVRRYNTEGPEAMQNRQYTHSHRAQPLLSPELLAELAELAEAVRGPAPGEYWIGRTVAAWISARRGRPVRMQVGWAYLVRLEGKRRTPRPRHVQAASAAQEAFKKS